MTMDSMFQHTAARRRLDPEAFDGRGYRSFNTQPPEGGWLQFPHIRPPPSRFNTQPPEGGWCYRYILHGNPQRFQHTAARRRLESQIHNKSTYQQFQHTAARRRLVLPPLPAVCPTNVSTHSRPKAAGLKRSSSIQPPFCFNTQPPEGGWFFLMAQWNLRLKFQHTAARRRLG